MNDPFDVLRADLVRAAARAGSHAPLRRWGWLRRPSRAAAIVIAALVVGGGVAAAAVSLSASSSQPLNGRVPGRVSPLRPGGHAVDRRVPVQHPRDPEPVIGFERLGGLHCLPRARARRWSGGRGWLSDAHEPDLSGQWGGARAIPVGGHRSESVGFVLTGPQVAAVRIGTRTIRTFASPSCRPATGRPCSACRATLRSRSSAPPRDSRRCSRLPPRRCCRSIPRAACSQPPLPGPTPDPSAVGRLAGPERRDPADPPGARPRSNPTSRRRLRAGGARPHRTRTRVGFDDHPPPDREGPRRRVVRVLRVHRVLPARLADGRGGPPRRAVSRCPPRADPGRAPGARSPVRGRLRRVLAGPCHRPPPADAPGRHGLCGRVPQI